MQCEEYNLTATNICPDDHYLLMMGSNRSSVFIIIRFPLSLLLIAFSGLTVLVKRSSTRLMEYPSAIFITNLGVAGGLIGTIIFIMTVLHLAMCVPLHSILILGTLAPRTLHIVTFFMLVCLTIDRYLALCWPLRYPALLTDRRCLLLTIASWITPIGVIGSVCVLGKVLSHCTRIRTSMLIYLTFFVSTISVIIVMYFLIAREFRRPVDGAVVEEELVRARHRTTKDLMVVVMMSLALATPDVVLKGYMLVSSNTPSELYHVTSMLLVVHLLCFYPLYAWKNRDFRTALLHTKLAFKRSCQSFLCGSSLIKSFRFRHFVRVFFTSNSGTTSSLVSLNPKLCSSMSTTTTTTTTTAATAATTTTTAATAATTTSATITTATTTATTTTANTTATSTTPTTTTTIITTTTTAITTPTTTTTTPTTILAATLSSSSPLPSLGKINCVFDI